jgi:hypothetical protein
MSLEEIAKDLTDLCRAGQFQEATEKYYGAGVVSVEPMGPQPVSNGLPEVLAKMQWWMDNFEMHGMEVDGPFINANTNTFVVEFTMDATMKQTGQRHKNREVAVYTVTDGKISHEQFLSFIG